LRTARPRQGRQCRESNARLYLFLRRWTLRHSRKEGGSAIGLSVTDECHIPCGDDDSLHLSANEKRDLSCLILSQPFGRAITPPDAAGRVTLSVPCGLFQ
jgi:hypothetical protein